MSVYLLVFKDKITEIKTIYVSYFSNELSTPLSTVSMGIKLSQDQIAKDTANPNEIILRGILQDTAAACTASIDVLNDLLLYDKLDSGSLNLKKQDVIVVDLVTSTVKIHTAQLSHKRIECKITTSESSIHNSGDSKIHAYI